MNTKFTLLAVTALTIAFTSNAQMNKGTTALGGNISFNTTTSKIDNGFKETTTTIIISPSLMMLYNTNRAIGFNLNYSHLKFNYSNKKSNGYGAGIFLKQYKSLGKGFYIFAQETLGYNYTNGSVDSSISTSFVKSSSQQINLTVNPGIAYDVSKKFQLELLFFNNLLSASYSHFKFLSHYNGADVTENESSFSAGANLTSSQISSLNLGAKIFFGR